MFPYFSKLEGTIPLSVRLTLAVHKGWNAPRKSLELVHPDGLGSRSSNRDLHISFDPSPDYPGIAKAAAGKCFGESKEGLYTAKADTAEELERVLAEAVEAVKAGRGAVVEAVLVEEDIRDVGGVAREVVLQEMEGDGG